MRARRRRSPSPAANALARQNRQRRAGLLVRGCEGMNVAGDHGVGGDSHGADRLLPQPAVRRSPGRLPCPPPATVGACWPRRPALVTWIENCASGWRSAPVEPGPTWRPTIRWTPGGQGRADANGPGVPRRRHLTMAGSRPGSVGAAVRRPVWPLRLGRSQDLVGVNVSRTRRGGAGTQGHALIPAEPPKGQADAASHRRSLDRSRTRWDGYRYDLPGATTRPWRAFGTGRPGRWCCCRRPS